MIQDPGLRAAAIRAARSLGLSPEAARSLRSLPSGTHIVVAEYAEGAVAWECDDLQSQISLETSASGRLARIASSSDVEPDLVETAWSLGQRIQSRLCPHGSRSKAPPLSSREREVLAGLSAGHTRGKIASHLGISIYTVDTYTQRVKNKLQAETLADLILASTKLL